MTEENQKRKSFEMRRDRHLSSFFSTPIEIQQALNNDDAATAIEKIMPPLSLNRAENSDELSFTFSACTSYMYLYGIWTPPPTFPQLNKMRDFIGKDSFLEISSERGLFASLLRCVGCIGIATSAYNYAAESETALFQLMLKNFTYGPVECLSEMDALQKYGSRVEVLILPALSLDSLRKYEGEKAIVIGEFDYDVAEYGPWVEVDCWPHPSWTSAYTQCKLIIKK